MAYSKQARTTHSIFTILKDFFYIAIGSLIAAASIQVFMIPNHLIDGGTIGISMILASIFGSDLLPYFIIPLTLPFIFIAYRNIGKQFVFYMSVALVLFSVSNKLLQGIYSFKGDILEIVVFGGVCLGAGTGLIIRKGGCLDGTEITAILINKWKGFTVGQVILFINFFIFALAGLVHQDWNAALRSLMLYMVAYKVIDTIIVGFEETKAVMIISERSQELTNVILHKMGLGVTIMYGRGGFSGSDKEIIYVIIERLQLVELKNLISLTDPSAFMAIQNLHEIVHPQAMGSKPSH